MRTRGLAGLLSIDGVAASNGKTLFLNGRLKAEKLKLAKNGSPAREPVEFDFALEHDMRRRSGVLRHGAIHIGQRARESHRHLRGAGRIHGGEHESLGARDARAAAGCDVAGVRRGAAGRLFVPGRHRQRQTLVRRPGRSAGHRRIVWASTTRV